MAKTALSVDELADVFVVYLGEMLAPLRAFSVLGTNDDRVKSTDADGGVYQVEVTGTVPSTADNVTNYISGLTSGTQDAVAVTTASVSARQTLTRKDQRQGVPFRTKMPDLAKGWAHGIWDKCTAMMGASSYGTLKVATVGEIVALDAQNLRASVDSEQCAFLTQHSLSGQLYPADREKFSFTEQGAYGYDEIHKVSNFTGGVANQCGLAASPEASVAISGLPLQDSQETSLTSSGDTIQIMAIPSLGLSVELRVWVDPDTRNLEAVAEGIFGISEADSSAATVLLNEL